MFSQSICLPKKCLVTTPLIVISVQNEKKIEFYDTQTFNHDTWEGYDDDGRIADFYLRLQVYQSMHERKETALDQ